MKSKLFALQFLLSLSAAATGVEAIKVPNNGIQPFAMIDKAGVVHMIYYRGTELYYVTRKNSTWSKEKQISGAREK